MSEDFDTMIFGAQQVIQMWVGIVYLIRKEKSDFKYLIEVYETRSQFSCNNLIMIVLLAGGDYNVSYTLF